MKKRVNNQFYIYEPYYGAWVEYGWAKDDWGIGLHKDRVDYLAQLNKACVVSYGKLKENQARDCYLIKAKKAQKFPIRDIAGSTVKLYIIPKSELKKEI